ncbi:hypothetical protein HV819_02355 [Anaerococcus sp. AGMB00486]|uniref:Phage protein n=2 Tax=Anaerococcus TaxID=165779 RepID=A0ABX2N836_9FIRM|nr:MULTISPECIES: hypothetical protein [Anaerococcus]MSS77360.1 hypothetical protein [Anaerococcus porci]NVF10839.1 hypothetical protein [Anaerococcus faecalis]
MSENKTSEAQRKANERWREKNKEKNKIYQLRSQAKRFINEYSDEKDLDDLIELLEERRKILNK